MKGTRTGSPAPAIACFTLALVWLSGAAPPRVLAQRTTLATPLETFAALPDTRTAWSGFIGRLDGGTAYALVSAVVLEQVASTPEMRRGISIELRHEGPRPYCGNRYVEWSAYCEQERAVVYIDEADLGPLREAYVANGHAAVHAGHRQDLSSWWTSSGGSGLILFGYVLRDRSVEEFVDLLAAAEGALKSVP